MANTTITIPIKQGGSTITLSHRPRPDGGIYISLWEEKPEFYIGPDSIIDVIEGIIFILAEQGDRDHILKISDMAIEALAKGRRS